VNTAAPPEKDFPEFKKKYGPRGVIHSWANDKDDPTEQPRWGLVGKQKVEDTGPLNKFRLCSASARDKSSGCGIELKSLLSICLLDGGAYGFAPLIDSIVIRVGVR
jgi:hypothetical protein